MHIVHQYLNQIKDHLREADLTTLAVHLFWIFAMIWWMFGFTTMLVCAAVMNQAITTVERRRSDHNLNGAPSGSGQEDA